MAQSKLEVRKSNCAQIETWSWLPNKHTAPIWSRLKRFNACGHKRGSALAKAKNYDIEVEQRLWSIWGSVSPCAACFQIGSRSKQFLACNVMACLAAALYSLEHWTPQLLEEIIISGDRYHRQSMNDIKKYDYEFSLENLATETKLCELPFKVHLEHTAFGKLYAVATRTRMNLANALMYFFEHFRYGVLQCQQRSLAIGRTKDRMGSFFMFDCQSRDYPIFSKGQGAAYMLRMNCLQDLLYCIVITLNVRSKNILFSIHKVEMECGN